MTSFEQPGKQTSHSLPQTIGETTLNSLPVLTDVAAKKTSLHALNADEIQQLLHRLESHIETLFTQKLALHLEQIQRQAIDLALDELKAELPALVRDAMHAYLESR